MDSSNIPGEFLMYFRMNYGSQSALGIPDEWASKVYQKAIEASRLDEKVKYWRKAAYGLHDEHCSNPGCMQTIESKEPGFPY